MMANLLTHNLSFYVITYIKINKIYKRLKIMWTPYELKLYHEQEAVMKAQKEVEEGLKIKGIGYESIV